VESLFPTLKRGANQVAAATASGAFAVLNKAQVHSSQLAARDPTPTQRVPRFPGTPVVP